MTALRPSEAKSKVLEHHQVFSFALVTQNCLSDMVVERAKPIDPESEVYTEPCYEERSCHSEGNIPEPLRIPLTGPDRYIKDANGWIHLVKDGREEGSSFSKETTAVAPPGVLLADLTQAHTKRATQWKESSCCKELTRLLQDTIIKLPNLRLDTCIGVGIGSFGGVHPYCPGNASFDQLTAFEAIVEILRQPSLF